MGFVALTRVALIEVDSRQRITLFNRGAEQLFGYFAHEALGRPLALLVPGLHPERLALTTQATLVWQTAGVRKNATTFDAMAEVARQETLDGPIFTFLIQEARPPVQTAGSSLAAETLLTFVQDAVIATDLMFRITSWNPGAEVLYGWCAAEVVGQTVNAVLRTQYLDAGQAQVLQQFQAEGIWRGEVLQRHRDGQAIPIMASVALVRDPSGAPLGTVSVNRDISERKAAEAQARAALDAEQVARAAAEAASARTARLQALTARLAGALTRESVVRAITDHSVAASGAVAAVLGLLDTSGAQIEVATWIGDDTPAVDWPTFPLDGPWPPSVVARTGEPLWLASQSEADARFPGLGVIMNRLGHHALAVLPLQSSNQALGALSFSYAVPKPFPLEERDFLLALTQLCAQALERAHLYTEVLESRERLQHLSERLIAVQEEERRHLARELHDEIGQTLSALSLTLGSGVIQTPEALAVQLVAAQRQVADLIAQVRQRSLDLRPAMLDDLGLRPALVWYLGRYQEQTGIRLEVELQGLGERFAPSVELTAYRIVQEALTNIARHARVGEATVLVWVASRQLMIEVIDSGRGFNLEAARGAYASNGLAGMGERVALLGGEMVIETEPGAGTRLFASLPLVSPHFEMEEPG